MDAKVPKHIGFIVDGNRRWAVDRGLDPSEGHLKGREVLHDVLLNVFDYGVEYVSAYLFSTENWKRSQKEVAKLMELFMLAIAHDIHEIVERNVRLKIIGDRASLSDEMLKAIDSAEAETVGGTAGELIICWNYGGQQEVVSAVKAIVKEGIAADDISAHTISEHLYEPDVPPCDVIVRTSGEQRLSNFMLWRSAYSELIFIDKYWPDMRLEDIAAILKEYNRRERRHGG